MVLAELTLYFSMEVGVYGGASSNPSLTFPQKAAELASKARCAESVDESGPGTHRFNPLSRRMQTAL